MSLTTPDKIRTLQRKINCKAKAEPAYRFYVLYDKICRADARTPGRWPSTVSANNAETSMVATSVMRWPPKASSSEAIGIEVSAALESARIKASTICWIEAL